MVMLLTLMVLTVYFSYSHHPVLALVLAILVLLEVNKK